MAVGVYQAARDCGIGIPAELSVIGYDDSPIASRVWPALTTVRLPIVDMARTAAAMLFAQEQGRTLSAPPVTPTLVVRASTARAA
jgi:LacI family transcriptional regulator